MLYHSAVSHRVFDLRTVVMETLTSMRRAGECEPILIICRASFYLLPLDTGISER